VLTHLDDSSRTAASPLRASIAARLAGTIQQERPAGADPRRWELDEDSELRLTDWLSIHVEVGWWTPPAALRESIEDVRRAVEQACQPAARAS
jgi:hypothetical protein